MSPCVYAASTASSWPVVLAVWLHPAKESASTKRKGLGKGMVTHRTGLHLAQTTDHTIRYFLELWFPIRSKVTGPEGKRKSRPL